MPLVADIAANQAIFEGGQLGTTPTLVHTLPSRVLSKFPKSGRQDRRHRHRSDRWPRGRLWGCHLCHCYCSM